MSGKRWTLEEDEFLHAYYDGLGDFIGEHDLGRPKGASTRRVRFLKKSGGWAALDAKRIAHLREVISSKPKLAPGVFEDIQEELARLTT